MFGFTKEEELFLRKLSTPQKMQDYLDALPFNHERKGETCMSPRRVLREQKANCIEGALLAAASFLIQGRPAYILNLKVDTKVDDDHVVLLFKERGYWGAVSKTNHSVLRYRDPVYKNPRELAMSYFHEYFLVRDGTKTMKGFSKPINLRRFGILWMTEEKDLWDIAEYIFDTPYQEVVPKDSRKFLRKATALERESASVAVTQ